MGNAHTRKQQKWIWALLSVTVVAAIGWWGVRLTRQQGALRAASRSGGSAPDFTLPSTAGGTVTLSEVRVKKHVLLYFHEGLSCDPCMQQIAELEKQLPEFEKTNVVLLPVSGVDRVADLEKSLDSYGIKKTPLLSYTSARTEVEYNLLPYSMGMGRRAGHTFILVGMDGAIKWRKDYWPGRGHMVRGGTMFVESEEIVKQVKEALNQR